jgi:hypothetical protein
VRGSRLTSFAVGAYRAGHRLEGGLQTLLEVSLPSSQFPGLVALMEAMAVIQDQRSRSKADLGISIIQGLSQDIDRSVGRRNQSTAHLGDSITSAFGHRRCEPGIVHASLHGLR